MCDESSRRLAAELNDAIDEARRRSPNIRLLWDNRECIFPSAAGMQALSEGLEEAQQPGDRYAILVSSSLLKVRAKQGTRQVVFISEAAAMTWLNTWE